MRISPDGPIPCTSNLPLVLAYVADLELEVDRLRRQAAFVRHEVRGTLKRVQQVCAGRASAGEGPSPLEQIAAAATRLSGVLRDSPELTGYHPAYDQVIAIAVRPLAEQVFRWQKRLSGTPGGTLRLELESEYIEWFPARLRHILDNLLSNALTHGGQCEADASVCLRLRVSTEAYELGISVDGAVLAPADLSHSSGLFYRAAPARAAGLGVGLSVVKLLAEQSGGTFAAEQGTGQESALVVVLPRYDVDDYLE